MQAASVAVGGAIVIPAIPGTAPKARAQTLPWEHPVPEGKISDYFGTRGGKHKGIDIAAALGSAVVAPAAMTITSAGGMNGYGTLVTAVFDNRWEIRIGHCTWGSVNNLYAGQRFERGQQFACIGDEGDSTGPHAHVELLVDGGYIDPIILTEGGLGPDATPDTQPAPAPHQPVQPQNPIIDALNNFLAQHGIRLP